MAALAATQTLLPAARWTMDNTSDRPGIGGRGASESPGLRFMGMRLAWVFLPLLLLIPLQDICTGSAQAAYDHALRLFQHGELIKSQREAEQAYGQFQISNPAWASKFQLLEAQGMTWRGSYNDALRVLRDHHAPSHDLDENIWELALEGEVLARLKELTAADQRLMQAEVLCKSADSPSCGGVLWTRGYLAFSQGNFAQSQRYYLDAVAFAQARHDRFLETRASVLLGLVSLQVDRYDEAIDWSRSAHRIAVEMDSEDLAQLATGNLGWAYYQLGDLERALALFLEADKGAARLGDIRTELKLISDAGAVYYDTGDSTRATQSYLQALYLARQIDSKEDITNLLVDLAKASIEAGKLDEANGYIGQVAAREREGNIRLSADVNLTRGMVASARGQDRQAEAFLSALEGNSAYPTTSRLDAGRELALLYEREGRAQAAEEMYKATLAAYDAARAQLKNTDSRLPFAANAEPIYDSYIHFLVQQGKTDEALAVADQSRARTLEEGLGVEAAKASLRRVALNPRRIAQKAGATLLFYWLGEKQSYLWAITPQKAALFPLPARAEIVARVERYRKALLNLEDPLESGNQDGRALYRLLVAPAAGALRADAPVIVLADGALNELNFETLLAPGPGPNPSPSNAGSHYWIEDATLLSVPSLAMLASARPAVRAGAGNLLLMGDAVSANEDYPELPLAAMEMKLIQKRFAARGETVLARERANPPAYAASGPERYAYIHFVTHGTASRVDPLDSAIILSPAGQKSNQDRESFKLYAREIVQHPIDARLVTVSACYGSGSRAYAGEGLVGLSWAFLRAGAHSVIAALWDVSDESTPRLMDSLYQGMDEGKSPSVALRRAKLALLRSAGRFRAPFYWAPFQIYAGP